MNRISGIVVLLLGTVILWQGSLLRMGSFRNPGPGFFPVLLAGLLIVLSIFLIIPATKAKKTFPPFWFQSLRRIIVVYGALLGYFFALEYLGFALSGFFLMMFLFVFIDRQKMKSAAVTAIIFMGLAYLLFNVILKSQLPGGVVGI